MRNNKSTLERAYELARSGQCASVQDLRARLKKEGFADVREQLFGRSLLTELRQLCTASVAVHKLDTTGPGTDG